jgi:hypothetical protein
MKTIRIIRKKLGGPTKKETTNGDELKSQKSRLPGVHRCPNFPKLRLFAEGSTEFLFIENHVIDNFF